MAERQPDVAPEAQAEFAVVAVVAAVASTVVVVLDPSILRRVAENRRRAGL